MAASTNHRVLEELSTAAPKPSKWSLTVDTVPTVRSSTVSYQETAVGKKVLIGTGEKTRLSDTRYSMLTSRPMIDAGGSNVMTGTRSPYPWRPDGNNMTCSSELAIMLLSKRHAVISEAPRRWGESWRGHYMTRE